MEVSLMRAYIFNIRDGYSQRNAVSLLLRRMNYVRTAWAAPGPLLVYAISRVFRAGGDKSRIAKCVVKPFIGWPFDPHKGE
jgi:hypothetical protein